MRAQGAHLDVRQPARPRARIDSLLGSAFDGREVAEHLRARDPQGVALRRRQPRDALLLARTRRARLRVLQEARAAQVAGLAADDEVTAACVASSVALD